jgi:hypothetical protein
MTQKEKRKQALRIFLSYALADRIYAHKLRTLLSRRPNLLGELCECRLPKDIDGKALGQRYCSA